MKKEKHLFVEKSKLARIKEDLLTPYSLPVEKNSMEEDEKGPILSTGPHCLR